MQEIDSLLKIAGDIGDVSVSAGVDLLNPPFYGLVQPHVDLIVVKVAASVSSADRPKRW